MIGSRTKDKPAHETQQSAYLQHVFNSCSSYNHGCDGCRWRLRCQKYYDQRV